MTGLLVIQIGPASWRMLLFNEGKIVDAECNGNNGVTAFREIIEINHGNVRILGFRP